MSTPPRPRGAQFPEVRHRGWRDFEAVRRQATNAIAGLGFGLDLVRREAAARVAAGTDQTLGEALGAEVPSALEFSFRPRDTAVELQRAERALADMAVPFAVAVYNEYLVDVVRLFDEFARTPGPNSTQLGDLHAHIATTHGVAISGRQRELFDLLAHLRNRIIHAGGRAGQHLVDLAKALSPGAQDAWTRVAGRPFPTPVPGKPLELDRGDAKAALATADHYASEMNRAMQAAFSQPFWADLVVDDYRTRHPLAWRHPLKRLDSICGYAAREYGVLGLSRQDVSDALTRTP
jgi:hypothetical protein